jgi:transcriptional regulator with XRE-family HTH domain
MKPCEHEMEACLRRFFNLLGRCVFARRKALNKTQEQVAEDSGLSRSEVQFAENGGRHMSVATLVRLCRGLGEIYPAELLMEQMRRDRDERRARRAS